MKIAKLKWKINNFKRKWKVFWCKHEWKISKFQIISDPELNKECKHCGKSK